LLITFSNDCSIRSNNTTPFPSNTQQNLTSMNVMFRSRCRWLAWTYDFSRLGLSHSTSIFHRQLQFDTKTASFCDVKAMKMWMVKQFWIANSDNLLCEILSSFWISLHVNDQKRLIYQFNQLILQTFELSFHLTMYFRTFLIDLNILCFSNQNHYFWNVETSTHMF